MEEDSLKSLYKCKYVNWTALVTLAYVAQGLTHLRHE